MLSILCPHCETQLTVEEQWRGKAINCLSCGKKLAVAATPPPVEPPESSVSISTDSLPVRRRSKGWGTRLVSGAMHLSITVATVYGGYYLISQRRASVEQVPPMVEVKPKEKPSSTAPEPVKQELTADDDSLVPEESTEPVKVVEAVPRVSPFVDMKSVVALPAIENTTIVTLVEQLPETEVRLLSNSSALAHNERKVLWNAEDKALMTVAGLTVMEGALKFRWMEDVPAEAEAALRNALVKLQSEEFEHRLALRTAQPVERVAIDLKKPTQKIICKCDFLPAAEDYRFELTGINQLPATQIEGADPRVMQIRDQVTLRYLSAEGAATRLTMKKRGKMAVVELESRYLLPSGEEKPMSIRHGNAKVKELDAMLQEAKNAERAIAGLKSSAKSLESQIKGVPRTVSGAVRLKKLQNELAMTRQRLQYAEQLAAKKSAIEADHKAIHRIAAIAQQLHSTELAYRFFTVVDGQEIDLVVGQ